MEEIHKSLHVVEHMAVSSTRRYSRTEPRTSSGSSLTVIVIIDVSVAVFNSRLDSFSCLPV